MPIELIHITIGCVFVAVWAMISQIVICDR
jgi:hypothetical protein